MCMLGVDMVAEFYFISIQQRYSLRSPYLYIFGPVCQRQFALVLGPGKECIFNYNVYSFSCQLCNIFIDLLSFSCFSICIIITFVFVFCLMMVTETNVINICFFCRIKFCLVLS